MPRCEVAAARPAAAKRRPWPVAADAAAEAAEAVTVRECAEGGESVAKRRRRRTRRGGEEAARPRPPVRRITVWFTCARRACAFRCRPQLAWLLGKRGRRKLLSAIEF